MESEIKYLIQMFCWLVGFWMTYFFFLKEETHFRWNRLFLLSGIICSIVSPLIPVHYSVFRELDTTPIMQLNQTVVSESMSPSGTFNRLDIIKMIYMSGVLLYALKFLFEVVKVVKLRINGEKIRISNTEVYQLEKETAPFSFFNKIYISKGMSEKSGLETIIAHEKVHVQQRHWVDLLLFELVRAIQWFNPLLFLYRKAIMANHEYLADSGAVSKGVSVQNYQAVLVNEMLGAPIIQLASSFTMFNHSKRLKMIKNDKSKSIKKWKVLWVLPVVAILLLSFAEPKYEYANELVNPSTSDTEINVKGRVLDNEGNGLHGTTVAVYSVSNGHIMNGTMSNSSGEFSLSEVSLDDEIVFSFVGFKTQRIKPSKKMTVVMEQAVLAISTERVNKKEKAPAPPPPPPSSSVESVEKKEEAKKVFFVVEQMPKYKGGQNELNKFIAEATANTKEKGVVSVSFIVNEKGIVQDISITESPSEALSEKAEKIMKSMPDWEPGKQRGKPVKINCSMQIAFE